MFHVMVNNQGLQFCWKGFPVLLEGFSSSAGKVYSIPVVKLFGSFGKVF